MLHRQLHNNLSTWKTWADLNVRWLFCSKISAIEGSIWYFIICLMPLMFSITSAWIINPVGGCKDGSVSVGGALPGQIQIIPSCSKHGNDRIRTLSMRVDGIFSHLPSVEYSHPENVTTSKSLLRIFMYFLLKQHANLQMLWRSELNWKYNLSF